MAKVADRYNLNKLLDDQTREEYQKDVANKFSTIWGVYKSLILGQNLGIVSKPLQKKKIGILETGINSGLISNA